MKIPLPTDVVSTCSTSTPVRSLTTRVYCVLYTCTYGICTQPQASLSVSIHSSALQSVLPLCCIRSTCSMVVIIVLLHKLHLFQGYRIRLQGYALWICCTHYTHICSLSQATPYKTYRFEANDLYQLEYRLIHLGISQYYDQTSSR